MTHRSFVAAVLMLVSSGLVSPSTAQEEADRLVHVGVSGGGTIPVGILADAA